MIDVHTRTVSPRTLLGEVCIPSVGILGTAEALAARLHQAIREAGWEPIPLGEILGDGASWMWTLADTHFPGVRQTLDDDHLSEHLFTFANLQ